MYDFFHLTKEKKRKKTEKYDKNDYNLNAYQYLHVIYESDTTVETFISPPGNNNNNVNVNGLCQNLTDL